MKRTSRPRVVLGDLERSHLLHDLETIEGRCTAVEEVLQVAAWRSGTNPSEWTERRLAAIRGAVADLLGAVQAASIDGD